MKWDRILEIQGKLCLSYKYFFILWKKSNMTGQSLPKVTIIYKKGVFMTEKRFISFVSYLVKIE